MQSSFWELLIVGVAVGISGLMTGLRIGRGQADEEFRRGEIYGRACGEIQGFSRGLVEGGIVYVDGDDEDDEDT